MSPEKIPTEYITLDCKVASSQIVSSGTVLSNTKNRSQNSSSGYIHVCIFMGRKKSRRTYNKMLIILYLRAVIFFLDKTLKGIWERAVKINMQETEIYYLKSHCY